MEISSNNIDDSNWWKMCIESTTRSFGRDSRRWIIKQDEKHAKKDEITTNWTRFVEEHSLRRIMTTTTTTWRNRRTAWAGINSRVIVLEQTKKKKEKKTSYLFSWSLQLAIVNKNFFLVLLSRLPDAFVEDNCSSDAYGYRRNIE